MADILTLLIITPFIRKAYRRFLVYYAFILFMSKELRHWLIDIGIVGNGPEFFEYYSAVQYLLIIGSAILLKGWARLISISLFTLFSFYNILIYLYWPNVPIAFINYYDLISATIIFIHVSCVTYNQKLFSKDSLLITSLTVAVYYTTAQFL